LFLAYHARESGTAGPICVLNNQFGHLEKVVFRFRVREASGKLLDDKGRKGGSSNCPMD